MTCPGDVRWSPYYLACKHDILLKQMRTLICCQYHQYVERNVRPIMLWVVGTVLILVLVPVCIALDETTSVINVMVSPSLLDLLRCSGMTSYVFSNNMMLGGRGVLYTHIELRRCCRSRLGGMCMLHTT